MKKVVIIGAGPAGLSCAYKLLKDNKKVSVIIIEADSQVGGISKTVNYHNNRMDIGGHRFFTKNDMVKDLWLDILSLQGAPALDDMILHSNKKLSNNILANPEKMDNVMLIRNRVSRIFYNKKFFDYPVNLNYKTIRNMGFATTCECGISYIKASFIKLKEINLENFYINRFGKKLYSMFFRDYTTKVWGRSPSEIDASWGSQRVKGISITKVIIDYFYRLFKLNNKKKETSLIESFYYPKYGPGQFYEELAKRVEKMGGVILKNCNAISINKKYNSIKNVTYVCDKKEKTISCDILVSSMPLKDLMLALNNVDKNVLKVSNNLPYRDFITVGILAKKTNLKNNINNKTIHGSVSDNWIYVQDSDVKVGRIQIFNNWSPYMVNDPVNTIWMGLEYFCNENDELWNMSDAKMKKFAFSELVQMGICDSNDFIDSTVIRVKKAYPAYFDSYENIDVIKEYINKINNLYCIGRNGTHSYNNMDHSIYSGLVCADMILSGDVDYSKLWNINVDSSYQEEK